MAQVLQVGVGSGGMPVLDALARDERITHVTLIEPDVFKPHNVVRHVFGHSSVGRLKGELAVEWLRERCPQLTVEFLPIDVTDPVYDATVRARTTAADVVVCAADNELAKYRIDELCRQASKPWTLGEVLSGGIGGWLHRFTPGGACYGCVASHLQRAAPQEKAPVPDYSAPGGPIHETTIPASKAAIAVIASLHALLTVQVIDGFDPGFTSALLTLQRVPDVFAEAYKMHKFRIERKPQCLICQPTVGPVGSGEDLDVALDQALARLGDE